MKHGALSSLITLPQSSTFENVSIFSIQLSSPHAPVIQAPGAIFFPLSARFLSGSAMINDPWGWKDCFISAWNLEGLLLCQNVWVRLSWCIWISFYFNG